MNLLTTESLGTCALVLLEDEISMKPDAILAQAAFDQSHLGVECTQYQGSVQHH